MKGDAMETGELIERLSDEVRPFAYVVGRWVWVEFSAKPSREVCDQLKGLGFWFNKKRMAWQHNCGFKTGPAKGYDPRIKYGAVPVSGLLDEARV